MKLYISLLFLLLAYPAFTSCSDDDTAAAPAPYDQYGSVFTAMPAAHDAIIYQVNVRSFSDAGTLNGVREKLGHIKELGANVIYLMPVYPVGEINSAGGLGSPYAIKNYKEINPDFGTLQDLRSLVDEAHGMGMAVILDWVANHTAWDNPWITEHPDWYQQDAEGNIIIPPGTNWNDVAQLNYDNQEMRRGMIDAMSYWVYNANIDGFRCDAADFVPQSFWAAAVPAIRGIKNQNMIMFAEGARTNHFAAGFDYAFGFAYYDALKKVYNENKPATTLQDAHAAEYANIYNNKDRFVRYTNNHDVNITDGTALELFDGKQGSLAAFVVAAYMKSIPMIYNGQEIAYNQRIDFFTNVPINWASADQDVFNQYKQILAFRNSSNAIKRGTYTGYSSNAISAFTMKDGNETVLVLSNLTGATANYILPPSLTGTAWNNAFTGAAANIGGEVTLQPFQYMVLKN